MEGVNFVKELALASEFDESNQISFESPQKCCSVSQGFGGPRQFLVDVAAMVQIFVLYNNNIYSFSS